MNIPIGTKLAVTVGIGVVLVAGMIVNQQLSNTSVARQTELARDEQFVIADLLSASVALQRMQVGTREIRLSIAEREADQALAGLRESMGNAVSHNAAFEYVARAEFATDLAHVDRFALVTERRIARDDQQPPLNALAGHSVSRTSGPPPQLVEAVYGWQFAVSISAIVSRKYALIRVAP